MVGGGGGDKTKQLNTICLFLQNYRGPMGGRETTFTSQIRKNMRILFVDLCEQTNVQIIDELRRREDRCVEAYYNTNLRYIKYLLIITNTIISRPNAYTDFQ